MANLSCIKEFLVDNDGVLAPGSLLEEENYIPEELEHVGPSHNLEAVQARPIARDSDSELIFFEDGIQRTLYVGHLIANEFHIPVHYCMVAAVVLRRDNRRFQLAEGMFRQRELMLVSTSNIRDPASLERVAKAGIEVVNTEKTTRNFNELCRAAQNRAKRERLNIEIDTIEAWAEQFPNGQFLVVDGTLMNLRSEKALGRCIGVSKEIIERYFDLQSHKKIYGLKFGERSWVFQFKTEEEDQRMGGRDRLSWYLRIRDTDRRHPEFGLLRCELHKSHANQATQLADRLSASLIAERYPVAFPDPRWDRLLYPVRQCEQYLRSRCRPVSSVQASFGRTQRM